MSYPFRALVLASVSKPSQVGADKYSIPDQLQAARAFCEARHWPIVAEITIPGHSRSYQWLDALVADCPEFAQLIALIQSRQIDVIVLRDEGRLWRTKSLQEQVSTLRRLYRVQIVNYNNPREPVPPDKLRFRAIDELLDSVDGYTQQHEMETFMDRIRGILAGRIARGLSNAGVPSFGYTRIDSESPFALTDEGRYWLRWMRDRRCEGWSYRHIGRDLHALGQSSPQGGQWSSANVRFVLCNPFYRGEVHWGEASGIGTHERPWTQAECDELDRINAVLKGPQRRPSVEKEFSLLCRCGFCQARMVYGLTPAGTARLVCGAYSRGGRGTCQQNPYYEDAIRAYVIAKLQEWLTNPAAWLARRRKEIGEATPGEIQTLDREIGQQEARWNRWNQLFEGGGISGQELLEHRERILASVDKLQKERDSLQKRLSSDQALEADVGELSRMVEDIPRMEPLDRRRIHIRLIRCIWLRRGEEPYIERI